MTWMLAIIGLLEGVAREYADDLIDEGLALARRIAQGKVGDEEIMAYIKKVQQHERSKGGAA